MGAIALRAGGAERGGGRRRRLPVPSAARGGEGRAGEAPAGAAGRLSSGAPHPPAGPAAPLPASLLLVSKLRNVSNLKVTYW